ncbi:hypothetical protein E1B28_003031 [Marasmius oreades]|uniref:DUF6593 domain-containing protein n=1 Tax=Marasmius oreades TaxID=181124 RepID=A0A9P7RKY4_9AGAR|nr:uncharacterized protein E1B28_003031 [Marasmius oreades]KAG7085470.1 hypothetical protein E1B28_003031 [Marasmius oreades]
MDLIFSSPSPYNASISLRTGELVYEISSNDTKPDPLGLGMGTRRTVVKKFSVETPASKTPTEIGCIELHTLHDDRCEVYGRDVRPKDKQKWTSSNGQEYSWKYLSDQVLNPQLLDRDQSTVAAYEHSGFISGKPQKLARLSISPGAGYGIVDEILVTFLYAQQKRGTTSYVDGFLSVITGGFGVRGYNYRT